MTARSPQPGRRLSRRDILRFGAVAAVSAPLLTGTARARPRGGPETQAAIPAATARPEETGQWTPAIPGPEAVVGIHAALLHTGDVLLVESTTAYVWNPHTGRHRRVDPPRDLFCAGHTILDDGDVLFVGGHTGGAANEGPPWNHTFRPSTGAWTRREDSRRGRWYPTVTALPDGSCLVTGGTDEQRELNTDVEVYRNGKLARRGEQLLHFYPLQHVIRDGRVLAVSTDLTGTTYLMDTSTFSFDPVGEMGVARAYAASVLLPGGPDGSTRVMMIGGRTHAGEPHATTQVFDGARPHDGWRSRAPLPRARVFTNAVILPDGTLLAVGGVGGADSDVPERQALLYDPALDVWKGLAAQGEVRGNHSTALLLPDGRVLSAGDNESPAGGRSRLEIFSPPYLFRGPRPTVTQMPEAVQAGGVFFVGTDADMARAVLVRAGCTTHSFDMSQRHVELPVSPERGGIRARVPGPNVAVPGWYLLFVLNGLGVPSVGRWLRVTGRQPESP